MSLAVIDPRAFEIAQLADLNEYNPDRSVMPAHHRQALEELEKRVASYGDAEKISADAATVAAEFAEFQAFKAAQKSATVTTVQA